MISWHKPGQKVAAIGNAWTRIDNSQSVPGPRKDEICTISEVHTLAGCVVFRLEEYFSPDGIGPLAYDARKFRPVYPTEVENLKRLCAPSPIRVKEDA